MRFGQFCFRPRPVLTLAAMILVVLFVWLGFWQLDRAAYKRELSATRQQQERQPALLVDKLVESAAAMKFRKIRATGRFEQQHQVFIENRKYQGKNGYHVVTPLQLENSDTRVLVNRGWVPPAAHRGSLPVVETPKESVEISGVADIPEPPALTLDERTAPLTEPEHWPYLTVERFAAGVDYPVQPFVILQSPQDEYGFVRAWPKRLPNDTLHVGYAIQWFAFAAIVSIIYLRLSVTRGCQDTDR